MRNQREFFGKGNNYHKFNSALAEEAIKESWNLGKLIELEKFYIPKLTLPHYAAMGIDPSKTSLKKQEAMKVLSKEVDKMMFNQPKLYRLIRQHMIEESRDEVAQELNYPIWHAKNDPETQ